MFNWLRRKLGLQSDLELINTWFDNLVSGFNATYRRLDRLETSLQVQSQILARLVAKVDPQYIRDPFDKAYRAESDAVGQKVYDKIMGEFQSTFPPTNNTP